MKRFSSTMLVVVIAIAGLAAAACSSAPAAPAAPQAPATVAPPPPPVHGDPPPEPLVPQAPAPAAPAAPAQQAFQSQVIPAPAQPIAQPTRAAARSSEQTAMASDADFKRGGHLIWGVGPRVFPPKWDMTQAGVWHFTEHFNRHYSGILQFNPRNGIDVLPDIGESWEFADSIDEITVNMVEGIKWHDGNPLTVEDIEFTLDRWVTRRRGYRSRAWAVSRTLRGLRR